MRIYLRALELDDYLLISQWRQDKEITRTLSGNVFFVSSEREKRWVEQKICDNESSIYLAICLKENDKMIGYTSINNIDLRNRKAEWGGTIIGDKSMWNKGYASEAAKLLLNYLFRNYPIHKCDAYCLEEHHITKTMFCSLGFHQDGMLRDQVYKLGEFKSLLIFSILEEEYFEKYGNNDIEAAP